MKLTQTLVVCLALLISITICDNTYCWKDSYGRGVGVPVSSCPSGYYKDGALCYPNCRSGYYPVGPVCWQYCPSGWNDQGALCGTNTDIYGKGCCCTIFGCCGCRSGYNDDGCTCRKDAQVMAKGSYGNGAGIAMSCGSGQVYDAGLCYQNCNSGYTGVGPVCWGGCPAGWSQCGAGCGRNSSECAGKIIDMVQKTAQMVANIAGLVTGAGAAAQVAQKVEKIASKVKTTASVASKLNTLISKIMAANSSISQADANTQAQNALAGVMMYQNADDLVDSTWDLLAQIDPTGVLAAAKAFYYPLCSKI